MTQAATTMARMEVMTEKTMTMARMNVAVTMVGMEATMATEATMDTATTMDMAVTVGTAVKARAGMLLQLTTRGQATGI